MVSVDIPNIMETWQPVYAGSGYVSSEARMYSEDRENDEANKSIGPLLLTYILSNVLPPEVPTFLNTALNVQTHDSTEYISYLNYNTYYTHVHSIL